MVPALGATKVIDSEIRGYKMKVVVTVGAFIRVVFLLGLLLALVILIAVGAISRTGYAALTDGSDVAVSYMV